MAGNEELSENQSEMAYEFPTMSRAGMRELLQRIIEECLEDPHGFVEREEGSQGRT